MGMFMINAVAPARLTLLSPGSRHLHFLALAKSSVHCGICRQMRDRHPKRSSVMACERCGLEFFTSCYFRRVATRRERVWFAKNHRDLDEAQLEAEGRKHPWICRGCRA